MQKTPEDQDKSTLWRVGDGGEEEEKIKRLIKKMMTDVRCWVPPTSVQQILPHGHQILLHPQTFQSLSLSLRPNTKQVVDKRDWEREKETNIYDTDWAVIVKHIFGGYNCVVIKKTIF